MTAAAPRIIVPDAPVTPTGAAELLRDLVRAGRDESGPGRSRTFVVITDLDNPEGLSENAFVVEHDRVGRLAVRLAVDKTLCVGDSRAVRAAYQGAVMEGSWGDEARIVPDLADVEALITGDPDWRPGAGDMILVLGAHAALVPGGLAERVQQWIS